MDQFSEYLKIYSTLMTNNDKVNFVKSICDADKAPQVLLALEAKDEAAFNAALGAAVVDPTVLAEDPAISTEVTPVEPEALGAVAPEGEAAGIVAEQGMEPAEVTEASAGMTPEQAEAIAPTVESVSEMTDDVKALPEEKVEELPEEVKEGVKIWRDASEHFTRRIIAGTVAKLHHGEFSEIEEPSEADVLRTGAEVAKELKESDEKAAEEFKNRKTSLDTAVEDIVAENKAEDVATLIRIYGELMKIKDAAEVFVDFISDKDDLELTASTRDKIVDEVLDNGLFENKGEGLNKSLMAALNGSKDYSARDYSEKMKVYSDFSEVETISDDGDISDDTIEILKAAGSFDQACEAVEEALEERGVDADDLHIDVDEVHYEMEGDECKSADCSDPSDISKLASGLVMSPILPTEHQKQNSTPTTLTKSNKVVVAPVRTGTQQLVIDRLNDKLKWSAKSDLYKKLHSGQADRMAILDKKLADPNIQYGYVLPTMGKIAGAQLDKNLGTGDQVSTVMSDLGDVMLAGRLGSFSEDETKVAEQSLINETIENVDATPADAKVVEETPIVETNLEVSSEQECPVEATKCSDYSEGEEVMQEQQQEVAENVAEQGLGSNDMIQALVEKYKMLPTIETKNFMIEDLRAKGFDESIISTILSMASGEFSEEDFSKWGDMKAKLEEMADSVYSTKDEKLISNYDKLLAEYNAAKIVKNAGIALTALAPPVGAPVWVGGNIYRNYEIEPKLKKLSRQLNSLEFSEGEAQGQSPEELIAEGAPVEDVVAPDLFDDLLGTHSLGLTDGIDGTLAPGALVDNGAEDTDIFSGLGTDPMQNDVPLADPSGAMRRAEVAQVVGATQDVIPEAEYPAEDDSFETLV